MTPKNREQIIGDGRNAEDKGKHKGDWGSHTLADREAEAVIPTEEQIRHAQNIINELWNQELTHEEGK